MLPPLSYLRYPRYRNYDNGYVVITSVGVSVVWGGDGCVPWDMSCPEKRCFYSTFFRARQFIHFIVMLLVKIMDI